MYSEKESLYDKLEPKKKKSLDFPGGPVAKIPSSQCPGWEFEHLWSGKILYATWLKNLKIIKNFYIPSPSAEVVEKLWSAPASVTPPNPSHPSWPWDRPSLLPVFTCSDHTPTLPSRWPSSQSGAVALQGVCWASTPVTGRGEGRMGRGEVDLHPSPPPHISARPQGSVRADPCHGCPT